MVLEITGRKTGLATTMEKLMPDEPRYWKEHYATKDRVALHFGLADRIRYYWSDPKSKKAVEKLRATAAETILPDSLLWQVFAPSVLDLSEDLQGNQVQRLVDAQIQLALDPYDVR